MSQTWANIPPTGSASVALKTSIPDALEALRTVHSGSSEPSATVAYMLWADTGTGLLKQRNSANTAWQTVGSLTTRHDWLVISRELGSISGTTSTEILVAPCAMTVSDLLVVSDTTTSGSDADNNVSVQIHNVTQATTMRAAPALTDGNEVAANTPWSVTPDQNADIAAGDVIRVTFTINGAGPVTVDLSAARVSIHLEGYTR